LKPKKEIIMTRTDLRIWYKQDTGKDIVDTVDMETDVEELEEVNEYVEWLEEGLMAAKEIIKNLQSESIVLKNVKL